nr:MAG: hypothetical protein [Penaeus semisulcatus pemonivirus]
MSRDQRRDRSRKRRHISSKKATTRSTSKERTTKRKLRKQDEDRQEKRTHHSSEKSTKTNPSHTSNKKYGDKSDIRRSSSCEKQMKKFLSLEPRSTSSPSLKLDIEKTTTTHLHPHSRLKSEIRKIQPSDSRSENEMKKVPISEAHIKDGSKQRKCLSSHKTIEMGLKKDETSDIPKETSLKMKKQIFRQIFSKKPKEPKVNNLLSTKMNWKKCKGNMCPLGGQSIICCCEGSSRSHLSPLSEPYVPVSLEDLDDSVKRCMSKIDREVRDLVNVLRCKWKILMIKEKRKNIILLRDNLRLRANLRLRDNSDM